MRGTGPSQGSFARLERPGRPGDSGNLMTSVPITIIVRHPKENPKKCSVLPLKGRPDISFVHYPVKKPLALDGYIRLAAEGPALSLDDRDCGILLLDGSWRWAGAMTQ